MAERCACGDEDCLHLALGYPYCIGIGCGDHHRPPVAADPRDPCPVDVNSVAAERADREGIGCYSIEPTDIEEARRRALARP